ncbi:peroxiredoxin [Limibacter armeniacum]|uniref:peroxiredoxin n=1 Tax=Limibacter armeniacum TaxID=466084 RepID=UPI002FE57D9C
MALKINSQAPDFTLPSTGGKSISLGKELADKPVVIYFYPKDFTPGCTKEACSFRDSYEHFRGLDIDIFGISKDDVASHEKFKETHNLPFDLLADVDGKVCKAYDALVPLIGIPKRVTYLLDKEHKVVGVYSSMFDSLGHIKSMIADSKEKI